MKKKFSTVLDNANQITDVVNDISVLKKISKEKQDSLKIYSHTLLQSINNLLLSFQIDRNFELYLNSIMPPHEETYERYNVKSFSDFEISSCSNFHYLAGAIWTLVVKKEPIQVFISVDRAAGHSMFKKIHPILEQIAHGLECAFFPNDNEWGMYFQMQFS